MISKNVLMIASAFPPMSAPGTFRALRFVTHLPEFGWNPIVVTVKPGAVSDEPYDEKLCQRVPDSVIIERPTIWQPVESIVEQMKRLKGMKRNHPKTDIDNPAPVSEKKSNSWLRQLRDLICHTPDRSVGWIAPAVIAGCRIARRYRPAAIVATGPPQSSYLIAVLIKAFTGIPIILDFRDPWARPEWQEGNRETRRRLQSTLERACIRAADRVVLNTTWLRDEFLRTYPDSWRKKFELIPNGFDEYLQQQVDSLCNSVPVENGKTRLCHPGVVYGDRDLRPLIGAVGQLVGSGNMVELDQIGEVANPPHVESYLRQHHLEHAIQVRGRLPHDGTLRMMAAADVLVVIQPRTTLQVPAKLFEMLPFKKPILALTGNGATADIINKYNLGVVSDPYDPVAIAKGIQEAASLAHSEMPIDDWQRALDVFAGRRLTATLAGILDDMTGVCNVGS